MVDKWWLLIDCPIDIDWFPIQIAVQTWFDDPHDVELLDLLPLLDKLAEVDSVYHVLRQSESPEPNDRSHS